jgi:hypothetical protein
VTDLLRFRSYLIKNTTFPPPPARVVIAGVFLASLLLPGCSSDEANRYHGETRHPARDAKEVEVPREKPARPFTVIADFQSRGETREALRRKAAKVGADAIIVTILGGYYDLAGQWAGQDRHNHTYTRIIGTAIKYNP